MEKGKWKKGRGRGAGGSRRAAVEVRRCNGNGRRVSGACAAGEAGRAVEFEGVDQPQLKNCLGASLGWGVYCRVGRPRALLGVALTRSTVRGREAQSVPEAGVRRGGTS
jgi:hypothetical protein